MYAYFKVTSTYSSKVIVFAETASGYFGATVATTTSTKVTSTGSTLTAVAVPLASGSYVANWSASGTCEKVDRGILIVKSSSSSVNYPSSVSTTAAGCNVTVIDAHGTHYGTPTGTGNYNHYSAVGVRHNTTDSGWTFKGWKVTLSHKAGDYYGKVLSNGGTESGNTYTFPATYDYAVVAQCGGSSVYTITFEALYEASTYTIHFDANTGSNPPSDLTATIGANWTCPTSTPTKSYKSFAGWSKSSTATTATYSAGGSYSALTTTIGATVTLYAVWTDRTCTVTFNANGGTTPTASKTVTVGQAYGTLPTPTYTDRTFVGWFTSQSGGSQVTASTTVTNQSNHTLYAHWTTSYVLKYDANGGSNAPASQSFTSSVTISTQQPTLQYKNFLGWSTSSSATTASYFGGQTYTFSGSTTLYAVWGDIKVTVTFNANGGTTPTPSKTVTVGQTYGDLPTPTRGTYLFFGWYTAKSGGSAVVSSTTVTNTSSHTLYAIWGDSSGYPLCYDFSSETGCLFRTMYLFGDCGSLTATGFPKGVCLCPTPSYIRVVDARNTNVGYVCPQYSQVMNTAYFSSGLSVEIKGSIGSSDVSINGARNSGYRPVRGMLGCTYAPNTMTLAFDTAALEGIGYKPYGWFVAKREPWSASGNWFTNMTGASVKSTATTFTLTNGQYLGNTESGAWQDYAVAFIPLVRKIDTIVVFNPNGGVISGNTYFKRVYKDSAYGTLPIPTYEGRSFLGWFTQRDGGTQVVETTIVSTFQQHTLYAHWKVVSVRHTLTFSPCGGTVGETSRQVLEGSAYGTLPTPTRANYNFVGWYTGTVSGQLVSASTVMGEEDTIIYARWSATLLLITFDANGGSVTENSRSIKYGQQIGTLPTPTYGGKNFDGWFTAKSGGTQVSAQTVPTSSVTYYAHWSDGTAQWTTVKYKMKFETNGGTIAGSYGEFKYQKGVSKQLPTSDQITRTGFTFGGWYSNPDFSGSVQTSVPASATGTTKYYAKWS